MIVNLIAAHQFRYLKYALICADSLIRRGSVPPETIHLVTEAKWANEPAIAVLRGYGVCIDLRQSIGGKFRELDRVLSQKQDYGICVQLDVDTMLTSDFLFLNSCSGMLGPNMLACYKQPTNPMKMQHIRITDHLVNYRFLWDVTGGADRFNSILLALFGFSLQNYLDWLTTKDHWLFGGVIIVRERFIGTPIWKSMVAMNTIVHCDETVMMLVLASRPSDFNLLDDSNMRHTVNPPNGIGLHILKEEPGILHYAGDWYRYENEHNQRCLDMIYNALVD